jgi:hypothetical protein
MGNGGKLGTIASSVIIQLEQRHSEKLHVLCPLPPGYTIPPRVLLSGDGADDGQDTGMTGVEEGLEVVSR